MSFKENEHLATPPDESIIWRYMDLSKFLSLITNKKIFFCNMNYLPDQNEGTIPIRNRMNFKIEQGTASEDIVIDGNYNPRTHSVDIKYMYSKILEKHKRTTLVSCWTKKDTESFLLWKAYAPINGIAIKTKIINIKNAIDISDDYYITDINYQKIDNCDNKFKILSYKYPFYKEENEVRIIIPNISNKKGKNYSVDVDNLIDEIYVSPLTDYWFFEVFKKIVSKFNKKLSNKIIKSEIKES